MLLKLNKNKQQKKLFSFFKSFYLLHFFILLFFYPFFLSSQEEEKNYLIPSNFIDTLNDFELDYSKKENWAFKEDINSFKEILPRNYFYKEEELYNVSVFYIHPTTLYNYSCWNADTSLFKNKSIKLCIENQASVFAGIGELYAPQYREMHIHGYKDTVNGWKAFNVAYKDVLSAFKYFLKNKTNKNYIIASHSQGTNHAVKLINEYISPNDTLISDLVLSYLIGMDVGKHEVPIPSCKNTEDVNCALSWRSFNKGYYPKNWRYGNDIISINPITFDTSSVWSKKADHLGILLPNKKILFERFLSVSNNLGLVSVAVPKKLILKKYISDSYHRADYNLFWVNIRKNLLKRLSKIESLK